MKPTKPKEKEPAVISDRVGNAFAVYAVMTTASDLLLRQTELAMLKDKIAFKKERKQVITELQRSIQRTEYLGKRFIEEVCVDSGQDIISSFDALLSDANLVVSLVMRFYNATYGDSSNHNGDKIQKYIRGLQVSDLFAEEQIKQFEKQV